MQGRKNYNFKNSLIKIFKNMLNKIFPTLWFIVNNRAIYHNKSLTWVPKREDIIGSFFLHLCVFLPTSHNVMQWLNYLYYFLKYPHSFLFFLMHTIDLHFLHLFAFPCTQQLHLIA